VRALLLAVLLLHPQETLRVVSDFPGGSAKVEGIDGRTVRVLPATRPDRGWVCWWYFKLEGIPAGEEITIDLGGGVWATPDRAVWSLDGKEWKQTPPGVREKTRIRYTLQVPSKEAWFAWGPPYVLADAQAAVDRAAKALPEAKAFELAKSRDGHSVPAVRIGTPGGFGLWVQARQHAWESGGSWVCQGFLDWIVSGDPRAAELRKKAFITVVPVMDADNVQRGAGGKEAKPQDHNRDWSEDPHWPEVRAAQAEIRKMDAEGRFDFFIDLHNPGAGDRNPFFYVSPKDMLSEKGQANLRRFLDGAKEEITGPLKHVGGVKESGKDYDPKAWERISKNWVSKNAKPHVIAMTLETSWNTPHSTAENYRQVGRELGLAIERYFRTSPR
jgi:hypothetical protein